MTKILDTLKAYQGSYFGDKHVIKFNGEVVFFGGVNVFKTVGIAKRAILNHTFGKNSDASKDPKNIADLDNLIADGIRNRETMSAKFTDEEGKFKSSFKSDQVGYIVELMEWVYEHNNMTYEEKLDTLLKLEEVHERHLKKLFPEGNYSWEKWSDKLKKNSDR